MKKIYYLFFIVSSLNGLGQNLVPNPSFEEYTICPNSYGQLSRCQFWHTVNETPDYFNNCSSSIYSTTPNNYNGFQYPHSGNAYTGLYTFTTYGQNNRELIGTSLISSLIIGQKYFISFYINLGGRNQSTIGANKMGVKFSTVPYSYSNPAPLNNIAHFYCNDIITDTIKWTEIRGSFIADSTYSYIMIGNFFNDSLTDTINLSTINHYAYYYIDDVCVSTDSLYCENWLGVKEQKVKKEEITIYPNPANTFFEIATDNEQIIKGVEIYTIEGKLIKQQTLSPFIEGGRGMIINTSQLPQGIYIIEVKTKEKQMFQKLIISQ